MAPKQQARERWLGVGGLRGARGGWPRRSGQRQLCCDPPHPYTHAAPHTLPITLSTLLRDGLRTTAATHAQTATLRRGCNQRDGHPAPRWRTTQSPAEWEPSAPRCSAATSRCPRGTPAPRPPATAAAAATEGGSSFGGNCILAGWIAVPTLVHRRHMPRCRSGGGTRVRRSHASGIGLCH